MVILIQITLLKIVHVDVFAIVQKIISDFSVQKSEWSIFT